MSVKHLFNLPQQFVDANGNPYSGALLFFYDAGSSTKQNTYSDSAGSVANPNPITLNSSGYPAVSGNIVSIYGTVGQTYKVGLAAPGSSDPPSSFIWTDDSVAPINDITSGIDEWINSGLTPTFIGASSFSFAGDQTSEYTVGRRLKFIVTTGTVYGRITASVFAAATTITMQMDGSQVLDSGLSQVLKSILRSANLALPRRAATASGTDTYTASVGIARYVTDDEYQVKIANTNATTTPSLNLDSLGAKTIVREDGSAVAAGDLFGQHTFRDDGTNMVCLNLRSPSPGANGTAPIADSTNTRSLIWVPQFPNSIAPNPFFQVDQLANSASSRADDNYGHDHWYVLTQTNSVQVSSQTDQEDGQPSNARLTQNQAVAQRMGYACIIEGKYCKHLRGQQVTFKPRIRCSSSQAIRAEILQWTGTEDSVTSDVVNDWTSSDYTDGAAKFFVDANFTPSGAPASVTPSANTWTDLSLTITLGSSFNNIVLFVWTEGTAAQNVTLDPGKMRFLHGPHATNIRIPTFDEVLQYSRRYFEKTFDYATAPAQSGGRRGALSCVATTGANGPAVTWVFKTEKRTNGATVTTYSPQSADVNWRDTTNARSVTVGVSSAGAGTSGVGIYNTAAGTTGDIYEIHATADIRL